MHRSLPVSNFWSTGWDRKWPLLIVIEGISTGNSNYSNPSTPLSFNSSHSDDVNGARISPTCSLEENNNQKLEYAPKFEIRVLGDWSIRQVIATIVEQNKVSIDWSDYALWWPAKKIWLHSLKSSLEQYEIPANAELHFTPMHKMLRIQLSNQTIEEFNVDFSVPVVQAVNKMCAQYLNIRHSEELSLSRPINDKMLRRNSPSAALSASELQRPLTPQRQLSSTSIRTNTPQTPIMASPGSTFGRQLSNNTILSSDSKSTLSISTSTLNRSLSNLTMSQEARARPLRPRNIIERARLNSTWLNSSRSLYEQDVRPWDLLDLRYKFLDFADLDSSKDIERVNYIYEQLRWSVINDEIDANDTAVYTLAAISLQVALKSGMLHNSSDRTPSISVTQMSHSDYFNSAVPSVGSGYQSTLNDLNSSGLSANGMISGANSRGSYSSGTESPTWTPDEQIESALNALDKSNSSSSPTDSSSRTSPWALYSSQNDNELLVVPQLKDKLKISSSKGSSGSGTMRRLLTNSNEKNLWVCLKDTFLQAYKYSEDKEMGGDLGSPLLALDLRRCEVQPYVQVAQNKFEFAIIEFWDNSKLRNGSNSGSSAVNHLVRCKDEREYAKWFTACSHAASGKTMAHTSYSDDLSKTLRLLQIQSAIKPTATKGKKLNDNKENNGNHFDFSKSNIELTDYVPKRIVKRKSKEQIWAKIQSLHHNYTALQVLEAQLLYINTVKMSIYHWDATLFIIKQINHKKTELLAIFPDKISLINPTNGSTTASWKYHCLYDWKVNWEVKQMCINFRSDDGKKNQIVEFDCLSADCKIIHEFIGGYIYMSIRHKKSSSGDYVQSFDQNAFLKLTGDQEDVEPGYKHNHIDRENVHPLSY